MSPLTSTANWNRRNPVYGHVLLLHIENCWKLQSSQSDHSEICYFRGVLKAASPLPLLFNWPRPNGMKMMALLCCSGLSAQHFQFVFYCHAVRSSPLPLSFLLLYLSSISVWLATICSSLLRQDKYPEWDNVWCFESRLFFRFCWTPEKKR